MASFSPIEEVHWGEDHRLLLEAGAACCDAEIDSEGSSETGDPTELVDGVNDAPALREASTLIERAHFWEKMSHTLCGL